VFREGTALESLESTDSRRFLPHAVVATLAVIVAPALLVVALSPLSGVADIVLSALLATGLSVAAGSAGSALWIRLPQSRDIPFADLMLWSWARRVRAERRLAKAVAHGTALGPDGELAGLRTLAVVFEARDGFSHGHSDRVARHAQRIARRLGLPEDEVERIEAAAAVHDVGMLRVPSAVLAKENLTSEERALVECHPVDGAERVAAVSDPATAALVRHHHERVDGRGYPDGLAGEQIPLGARIIAVADRFDELVSPRRGQASSSRRNALDELSARSGSELDATVVAAFVGYYSGARSIAGVAFAATAPQRAVRWLAAAPATIGAAGAPVAVQGVCAAGTAALASACLTVLPAADPPQRDDQPAAPQRAERPTRGEAPLTTAQSAPATDPRRSSDGPGREPFSRRDGPDDVAADPRSGAPQAPTDGGDVGGGGGGGTAPTSPPAAGDGGGGGQPTTGGGGGGSGGGQPSATPAPRAPSAPVQAPQPQQVEAPQPPPNPVSQLVDPVLDGVSEAVPPTEPVTEGVKGLVGGLTGGGQ
jgi:HD-GYP domain-containing protein (c-di-GMP phosphodiesterase class II)